jgi:hypothetical protein
VAEIITAQYGKLIEGWRETTRQLYALDDSEFASDDDLQFHCQLLRERGEWQSLLRSCRMTVGAVNHG